MLVFTALIIAFILTIFLLTQLRKGDEIVPSLPSLPRKSQGKESPDHPLTPESPLLKGKLEDSLTSILIHNLENSSITLDLELQNETLTISGKEWKVNKATFEVTSRARKEKAQISETPKRDGEKGESLVEIASALPLEDLFSEKAPEKKEEVKT
jgi:hypothetical protein